MKFKDGIKEGSIGGYGLIKYTVEKYDPNKIIEFRFLSPYGFNGIHKFEITELTKEQTKIKHTINMKTSGKGTLTWIFVIRSLNNALIEDSFDKIETIFLMTKNRPIGIGGSKYYENNSKKNAETQFREQKTGCKNSYKT